MRRFSIAICRVLVLIAITTCVEDFAMAANVNGPEAAYTQEITKRADKIVGSLELGDEAARTRVRDLIAQRYKQLREIHDTRDAKIAEARKSPGPDRTMADSWTKVTSDAANLKVIESHRRFVARLSVELAPEQVEKVKDGMTYGVVPVTYKRYLELLPGLTDEQKREILATLVEAREYAMDAGSSEEKHAIFNKFKGRINNFISAAGYDLKQAEKELAERRRSSPQNR